MVKVFNYITISQSFSSIFTALFVHEGAGVLRPKAGDRGCPVGEDRGRGQKPGARSGEEGHARWHPQVGKKMSQETRLLRRVIPPP